MAKFSYKVFDPKIDSLYAVHKNGTTIKDLGQQEKADAALNFNYADTNTGVPIGRVIAGGKTVISDIPKTVPRDEIYMLPDKSLHIGKAPAGALWALQGSPPLLRDGKNVVAEGVKRDQTGSDIHTRDAIRSAVGVTLSGKLVMLRTYEPMSLNELASLMAMLGCMSALNGDGGGSSYLYPADSGYGRKLGAALIAKKGAEKPMEKEVKPAETAGIQVIIDPGHGGTDPGAGDNGITEKDYTLQISLYQQARLKALGVTVALTRSTDKSLDAAERTTIVKASRAKYCISNHINAATSADAAGVETIHSIHSDGKLANALAKAIAEAGQPFRRVFCRDNDGEDYYFMHRLTGSASTVIVEYGFLSNEADASRIKANWKTYAEAVVRSFCSFIGHAYTKPQEVVQVPQKPTGTFKDVPDNHYAKVAIEKAAAAGVINGVAPGEFGLGKTVTREQLAVILDRLGLLK